MNEYVDVVLYTGTGAILIVLTVLVGLKVSYNQGHAQGVRDECNRQLDHLSDIEREEDEG